MKPQQSAADAEAELTSDATSDGDTAATAAPTVPPTSADTDDVALNGEHDSPADDSEEQHAVQAAEGGAR